MAIEREVNGSKGRYVLRADGAEAELTFSILSPEKIIVDHTGVPESLRGKGYGRALAERMVADARDSGVTVVPLCPFVNMLRRKQPDWSDVFGT